MRFPFKSLFQIVTGLALLSACSYPVKEAEYAPSPQIPESAAPTPIKYSGIELLLPPGMDIGHSRGGYFCASPAYPVNRNVLKKEIDTKFLRQSFHDAMEANGYDVVGSLDILFDPEDEEQRAEYSIKGTLKDAQLDMCDYHESRRDWLSGMPGQAGKMYVQIDWSVYDRLRRKVVYKTSTEGYTKRRMPNTEGMALLFHDAFEMSVHNLAADEPFRALIVDGTKPPKKVSGIDQRGEKIDKRPRLFDEDEEVTLITEPLSRQPFAKNADQKSRVAVTLDKGGHGSGFFITNQGHIITNASVVGEARKIRVVTASKKTGIIAEVLRVNRGLDVALLRLEEIPEWLEIQTLPIRLDWPDVGEDVYALGTPYDKRRLKTTLSKGIISAHRKNFKFEGIRHDLIQADVEVHAGHAGGPLIDEYGNIVAITVKAYLDDETSFGNGLNFFIPIRDALDTLDIAY